MSLGVFTANLRPGLGCSGRLSLHVAFHPRVLRFVSCPRSGHGVGTSLDSGVASQTVGLIRQLGGVAKVKDVFGDLLDLPGLNRVGSAELFRETVGISSCLRHLPCQHRGGLVVAVTSVEGGGPCHQDFGSGLTHNLCGPAQRFFMVPQLVSQRRGRVVEEVHPVKEVHINCAVTYVRRTVFVFTSQAQVRPGFGAD